MGGLTRIRDGEVGDRGGAFFEGARESECNATRIKENCYGLNWNAANTDPLSRRATTPESVTTSEPLPGLKGRINTDAARAVCMLAPDVGKLFSTHRTHRILILRSTFPSESDSGTLVIRLHPFGLLSSISVNPRHCRTLLLNWGV